jgi:hypothetical protein
MAVRKALFFVRLLNNPQYGVEVEGGKVPTRDWLLNLQILTSGGFC